MKCYYKNPEATAEILKDGWLLTGDMAKEDEDGFIYLVDRKKDVIISGGENIYPVQIEDFLRANDAIKDAAVIGQVRDILAKDPENLDNDDLHTLMVYYYILQWDGVLPETYFSNSDFYSFMAALGTGAVGGTTDAPVENAPTETPVAP
jgi:acyl-CoA synthetase (AMP-forming)/AMP-acid ligase II